jgi:YfiH family protein
MPEPLNAVRRTSGALTWFEPETPLGGVGRLVMTTRGGGISKPPYDSLNLGFHVEDVAERVRLNRLQLQKSALPKGLRDPVVGEQVHGTVAAAVGELHAGARWQGNEPVLSGTDALVTASRRLPLVTLVADCLPVALVDPIRRVAAAVHAGWRGLSDGVLENALSLMRETWETDAADVIAWIGPGIGPCCYEVGPDVAEHFPGFAQAGEADRSRLDLRGAASERLAVAGLRPENTGGLELCTSCESELFFSHRRATRDGLKTTGRQALIVWLDPPRAEV